MANQSFYILMVPPSGQQSEKVVSRVEWVSEDVTEEIQPLPCFLYRGSDVRGACEVLTPSSLMSRGADSSFCSDHSDHLLCFGDIECQIISGAPVCQSVDLIPVGRFITILYQANYSGVIREFKHSVHTVDQHAVMCVKGKQKRTQHTCGRGDGEAPSWSNYACWLRLKSSTLFFNPIGMIVLNALLKSRKSILTYVPGCCRWDSVV